MTKIDIFSGFLGAGKTTLIKKLIEQAYQKEKLVLIENEFGEIGIDGGFLKEAGITVNEMNSGCICCSLVGDFSQALSQVLSTYSPDRILIEPSGVGKLSDVVKAVAPVLSDDVTLNFCCAVADVTKCQIYLKNFGEFYRNQIESADTIVLSRTSAVKQDKFAQAVALLREVNPDATIVTTPWEELDGALLLKTLEQANNSADVFALWESQAICPDCGHVHHHEHHHHHEDECECHEHHHHHHEEECECHEHHHHHEEEECECHEHHHHHHHHADEVFASIGMETTHAYTEQELHHALHHLDDTEAFGTVLRAKGIVRAAEGQWFHFDFVPGEIDIRRGSADVIGRICVIGSDLQQAAIKSAFLVQ